MFVTGGCAVAAVLSGAGVLVVSGAGAEPEPRSSVSADRNTAPVTTTDLVDTTTFPGSLGYGTPVGVPGTAPGTITWLPEPGAEITRDEPVYAVDERPVRAMHGSVPLWRTLERGVEGTDVRQLNENLAALGYDVSVDDVFGPRTERAVRQWQHDRGYEETGSLTSSDIVFLAGDVRVDSVVGALGQAPSGDVLTVTGSERVVVTSVTPRRSEQLPVGSTVQVRVNGAGALIDGTVTDAVPGTAKDGGAVVDVTVGFDPGDRKLPSTATAQVIAPGARADDALTVPVPALVAGDDGGYAVDVLRRDGTVDRVAVEIGLVAAGRVAVTGDVADGDRVVVP